MSDLENKLTEVSQRFGFLYYLEKEVDQFKYDHIIKSSDELISTMGITEPLMVSVTSYKLDLLKKGALKNIFRKSNSHIKSRLYNSYGAKRDYKLVEVRNGNHSKKNRLYFKYEGFFVAQHNHIVSYGDIKIKVKAGDFVIKLGDIVKKD